jgi:hypothetical protein
VLDSLVRVSRRVGWATDAPRRPSAPLRGGVRPIRSHDARQHLESGASPPRDDDRRSGPPRRGAGATFTRSGPALSLSSVPAVSSAAPTHNPARGRGRSSAATFRRHGSWSGPNRSRALRPGRNAPGSAAGSPPRGQRRGTRPRSAADGEAHGGRAESPGPTLRSHPFASRQFHALLNSLFKVLFNFPSRYLFAIGLVPVFSLRWSFPPTFGLHSQTTRLPEASDSADPAQLWV